MSQPAVGSDSQTHLNACPIGSGGTLGKNKGTQSGQAGVLAWRFCSGQLGESGLSHSEPLNMIIF